MIKRIVPDLHRLDLRHLFQKETAAVEEAAGNPDLLLLLSASSKPDRDEFRHFRDGELAEVRERPHADLQDFKPRQIAKQKGLSFAQNGIRIGEKELERVSMRRK